MEYNLPPGMHVIPKEKLDLRSDAEVDESILHPPKPDGSSEKNVWFFWHSGYASMHPYCKRNVRAWHRRLSPLGWTIRVVDRHPGSVCHIANYLDVTDAALFPQAFRDGTIGGAYALQHYSDLVRWPLLLVHGGVYADVGMLQIGDLDRLWAATVGDPSGGSPYEVLSYAGGDPHQLKLTNYFLCSRRGNPLFLRAHRLFLALWEEDGGKHSTEGMHASPLIREVPPLRFSGSWEENGVVQGPEEGTRLLTDYIMQGQALTMAMGIVDPEDGWDGPKYVKEHVYAIEFMVGAQLINELTAWDGNRAWELMSLPIPKDGDEESADQKVAREIVEACLSRSFGFKLATGLILKLVGETLSSLWRRHVDSDDVPGTYAHWLRYGMVYWTQDHIPPTIEFTAPGPLKIGPLLRPN